MGTILRKSISLKFETHLRHQRIKNFKLFITFCSWVKDSDPKKGPGLEFLHIKFKVPDMQIIPTFGYSTLFFINKKLKILNFGGWISRSWCFLKCKITFRIGTGSQYAYCKSSFNKFWSHVRYYDDHVFCLDTCFHLGLVTKAVVSTERPRTRSSSTCTPRHPRYH